MKAILALGLLAVVAFAAAGCGATKKTASAEITDTGGTAITNGGPVVPARRSTITVLEPTATVANVKRGIWIRCKGWPAPGVKVPPPGQGLLANVGERTMTVNGTSGRSVSRELRITRLRNGTIRVVCKTG